MLKNILIKTLNKTNNSLILLQLMRQLKGVLIFKVNGTKKKYPKVIQLPLTYNCDSKCVMCNIWQMDHSGEATASEFSEFMKDDLFKKVEAVGINGGEVSLIPNLTEYALEILKLPSIKSLNIISNGFRKEALLDSVSEIYKACKLKGVSFHLAISLDGVGAIHDEVRGVRNAFKKTTSTIDEIIINQHLYCDSYDLGCTVIHQNIDHLVSLDTYAKAKKYNIKFRLGIENLRIESDKLVDQFSVLYNADRQSAMEFFHYKYTETKLSDIPNKLKYFSIFFWLAFTPTRRLLGCAWKDEGVTLDSRGELYYCAVKSERLGGLREGKGEDIFFNADNINYRESLIKDNCDSCIHDYNGELVARDLLVFYKALVVDRLAMKIYKFKLGFMR
jgi:MoaA/NifB/PqqE/SkfB family radical SAM enzyme